MLYADAKSAHTFRTLSATLLTDKPLAAQKLLKGWYSDYLQRTEGLSLRRWLSASVVFSPYRACCCTVNHVRTDYNAHV
ncbi:hypothetical protein TNIN_371111 [Trichonephila inaurata madagascariensis]|uniref:Uncharacterized protein n=1 Tax=Trichonephila inaurata madagascariensis TaxID=2747483 RepID=A0A8X6YN31_9ARAC|nr:hypothetical protein TNIN_371111 [Trichonephila inaurata madagascariensis]